MDDHERTQNIFQSFFSTVLPGLILAVVIYSIVTHIGPDPREEYLKENAFDYVTEYEKDKIVEYVKDNTEDFEELFSYYREDGYSDGYYDGYDQGYYEGENGL